MLDTIRWDADLIRRYDLSGPRYTSYPTAVQFHEGIGPFDQLHALRDSRKAGHPLSLYVHIPFCANICYYCACNKVITKDRGRSAPYLARLVREIEIVSRHLSREQVVEQLHFGGGTPTFLSPGQLRELMSQLRTHLNLLDDDSGDYGIEIDPREADWSTMGLLRELGFNRVSLGVQDFDMEVQKAVNRMQTPEETRTIVEAARTLQYRSINLDLIYGLPKQTPDSFARTVDEVIALQPDRLSVFNYAHLPERFMPQRRINADDLPSPGQKLEMLQRTTEQLATAGYRYIGMDHFALPDDELTLARSNGTLQRNFQGYSTHADCDLIALGVSSISKVGDTYGQNVKELSQYYARLDEGLLPVHKGYRLSDDDRLRREVINALMCHGRVDYAPLEECHGIRFAEYFAGPLKQLQEQAGDGLIELHDDALVLLPQGQLMMRSVAMAFDAYLGSAQQERFSRTI